VRTLALGGPDPCPTWVTRLLYVSPVDGRGGQVNLLTRNRLSALVVALLVAGCGSEPTPGDSSAGSSPQVLPETNPEVQAAPAPPRDEPPESNPEVLPTVPPPEDEPPGSNPEVLPRPPKDK
jgi:hypothetical protein